MTLKIKLASNGIEIIDFDILPHNVKDGIIKILDYARYSMFKNTILVITNEEIVHVLYLLNDYFDLFIKKGN